MPILLRTLTGEGFSLDLDGKTSVNVIKNLLKDKYNFLPQNVSLIYNAKVLHDKNVVDPNLMKPNEFVVIHEKRQNLRLEKKLFMDQFSIPPVSPIELDVEYTLQYSKPSEPISLSQQTPFSAQNLAEHQKDQAKAPEIEEHPGFNKNVAELVEMGFERDQAAEFFRAVKYDIDAAIQALKVGEIPLEYLKAENESESDSEEIEPLYVTPKKEIYDLSGLDAYDFGTYGPEVDKLTRSEKNLLLIYLGKFPHNNPEHLMYILISCKKDFVDAEYAVNAYNDENYYDGDDDDDGDDDFYDGDDDFNEEEEEEFNDDE